VRFRCGTVRVLIEVLRKGREVERPWFAVSLEAASDFGTKEWRGVR